MSESYATLEELQNSFIGEWKAEWDVPAVNMLEIASARIRQSFRNCGLNFDERISEGLVEIVLLKGVVCDIVKRSLNSSSAILGGEFSQLSQSAGAFSMGITPSSTSGGLWIKRDELKMLGLPTIFARSYEITGN